MTPCSWLRFSFLITLLFSFALTAECDGVIFFTWHRLPCQWPLFICRGITFFLLHIFSTLHKAAFRLLILLWFSYILRWWLVLPVFFLLLESEVVVSNFAMILPYFYYGFFLSMASFHRCSLPSKLRLKQETDASPFNALVFPWNMWGLVFSMLREYIFNMGPLF